HAPSPISLSGFHKLVDFDIDSIEMHKNEGTPPFWFETSNSVCIRHQFQPDGHLSVILVDDSRPLYQKLVGSFMNKFFPSGYPFSVNEGYLRYTQF
ncbi:hypothetical protein RYX36_021781, partial [Vicia faba]